jgi:hypothetical protein
MRPGVGERERRCHEAQEHVPGVVRPVVTVVGRPGERIGVVLDELCRVGHGIEFVSMTTFGDAPRGSITMSRWRRSRQTSTWPTPPRSAAPPGWHPHRGRRDRRWRAGLRAVQLANLSLGFRLRAAVGALTDARLSLAERPGLLAHAS